MKNLVSVFCFFQVLAVNAQVKLHLDSSLKAAYVSKYHFSENLVCIPFYCDPFFDFRYKKTDTLGLCGRYVFVNRNFEVKIGPVFQMPCWFEPRFSEGLCAVNIEGKISFIDSGGKVRVQTGLEACSPQRNRVMPFRNGKAKVYKGSGTLKNYFEVYYLDRTGHRLKEKVMLYVRLKDKPFVRPAITVVVPNLPLVYGIGKYPLPSNEIKLFLKTHPHKDNRMLLYFDCGLYQVENMNSADTIYCGKFVFVDSFFNLRIHKGFTLPCSFEPEFSEGLCAVSIDSLIVYIDTAGKVLINTGMKACGLENNKASTFKNGIATLYQGDRSNPGIYTTVAINIRGERVRLLEFDELELAVKKVWMFRNLTIEEAANCFVGKGKTNGFWFLIEKSGKIRKKLELK